MAKKPVNLTVQTIYILIPILAIIALYRVEKLKFGILIVVAIILISVGIDHAYGVNFDSVTSDSDLWDFKFYSEHPDLVIICVAYFVGDFVLWIYLIRKWSREWNGMLSANT